MMVVDAGNTSLHFYWITRDKILHKKQIGASFIDERVIRKIISERKENRLIVCSVVPRITAIFNQLKKKLSKVQIFIIGQDLSVPIKCFYNQKHVGMDRVIAAYAAKFIYKEARIIIDFGTAITFDILSKQGDYEGGLILPGIGSTLKVLSSCALLPKTIKLKRSKVIIPRDTKESIYKGLEESFSSMINYLVAKYKKILKLPSANKVIITGGDAAFILPDLNFRYTYKPFLVAKGLIRLGGK